MENKFYIVDKSVLPETFLKVMEVKKLLQLGKFKTVNEAAKHVRISRSAFYKYKDYIFPFVEKREEKILTFNIMLMDEMGVLSKLISYLSQSGANILTINQNIPIDGIAPVSISVRTSKIDGETEEIIEKMKSIEGVLRMDIVAGE